MTYRFKKIIQLGTKFNTGRASSHNYNVKQSINFLLRETRLTGQLKITYNTISNLACVLDFLKMH